MDFTDEDTPTQRLAWSRLLLSRADTLHQAAQLALTQHETQLAIRLLYTECELRDEAELLACDTFSVDLTREQATYSTAGRGQRPR